MDDYLRIRLGSLLNELKKDLDLISSKKKDEEWKRDHYRYSFTVFVQRIYKLLNTSLTEKRAAPVTDSTIDELMTLREMIDGMISSQRSFD